MTQIEKFKRWADKQGWFLVVCSRGDCRFILPDGYEVVLRVDSNGNIVWIE